MKKIYTQQTIDQFFDEFKNLPNSYKIEQVHQLLNKPYAKATHNINTQFKYLKILIMASGIIISLITLLLFNTPKKPDSSQRISEQNKYLEIKTNKLNDEYASDSIEIKKENNPKLVSNTKNEQKNTFAENSSNTISQFVYFHSDSTNNKQIINKNEIEQASSISEDKHEIEIPTIEVPILELSKAEMENLGFIFYKDSIVFTFNDNCNKYITIMDTIEFDLKTDSAQLIDEKYLTLIEFKEKQSKGINQFTTYLSSTSTSVCGNMSLKDNNQILIRALTNYKSSLFTEQIWRYNEDMKDGYYPEMTINDINLNLLVPIKCSSNDPELKLMFNKHVFWMYPNNELFSKLPKRLSMELQQEFNKLSSKKSNDVTVESSCIYYEVCKSTLQLENFKLYPNPAKYSIILEFDLSEEIKGSVSIINMAGVHLNTLIPISTFQSGQNSYQMELSGIAPGIYLISINTTKGFKTQRIIVSK